MIETVTAEGAPKAIGPYSHAAVVNGTLMYLSGQIALDLSGTLVGQNAAEQTEQIFANIIAVLSAKGLTLDNVFKTTVFLASMSDFTAMNDVYGRYFNTHLPARSAIEVAALPKGALVEIEVIACP